MAWKASWVRYSQIAARMALGAGRMKDEMPNRRQASSQRRKKPRVKTQGARARLLRRLSAIRPPRSGAGDVAAQLVDDVGEGRRVGDLEVARAGQVDLALGDDAAGPRAHAEDAVGEERRLAQVVGDEDDRDAARRVQVADHAPQLFAREGVEGAEGLVEHQQLRLVDERAAERGALLHAAGELPRDTCRPDP